MEDSRKTYKEKFPSNKSVSVVGKAGGEKWKSMSDAKKAPFVAKPEKRKTEYNKAGTKVFRQYQSPGFVEDMSESITPLDDTSLVEESSQQSSSQSSDRNTASLPLCFIDLKGHAEAKIQTVNQQMYAKFHVPVLANTQTFTPIRNLSTQIDSINFSGLPSHKLIMTEGCSIILTRNIDLKAGLSNGTRLICNKYYHNVITVEIVSGSCKGQVVFIPRISQKPSPHMELPFSLRTKQFPIRLLG